MSGKDAYKHETWPAWEPWEKNPGTRNPGTTKAPAANGKSQRSNWKTAGTRALLSTALSKLLPPERVCVKPQLFHYETTLHTRKGWSLQSEKTMFNLPSISDAEVKVSNFCWSKEHYQCVKPCLSRICWEKELLRETNGVEEQSWEEIMMQLVCEPLRVLGKAVLCPVPEITW